MLFCQVNPAFVLIQPPFSVTIDTRLPLVTICHAGGRAKRTRFGTVGDEISGKSKGPNVYG